MQPNIATDIDDRRKRYAKVLLANQDVLEAREYLRLAAGMGPADGLAREDRVAHAAYISAFVVAYGRCFVSSRHKKKALPDFTDRFVASLETPEARLHGTLRNLRDQEFAHSDANVADIDVAVTNERLLVPISRILRLHSLAQADLVLAETLVDALIVFLTQELIRLQEQLTTSGGFSFREQPGT